MRKTILYFWLIGMLSFMMIPENDTTNTEEVEIVSVVQESSKIANEVITEEPITKTEPVIINEPIEEVVSEPAIAKEPTKESTVEEPEIEATEEEIELLALLTVAESEGQPEKGQRLVIDTVLNRVEHEDPIWPDTINEVIYQPNQFSAMWNDRVERSVVTDEVRNLVREELASRTNTDTLYFRANQYSIYGEPMFSIGDHYFSSY